MNGWNYVEANPINATDPSGRCLDEDMDGKCDPGWWCISLNDPIAINRCLENTSCTSYHIPSKPTSTKLSFNGQRVYETYLTLKYDVLGYWNKYVSGNMDHLTFLAIGFSHEFSGVFRDVSPRVLAETVVRNFYYLRPGRSELTGEWGTLENTMEYIAAHHLLDMGNREMLIPEGKSRTQLTKADKNDLAFHWRYTPELNNSNYGDYFRVVPDSAWRQGIGDYNVPMDWANASVINNPSFQYVKGNTTDYDGVYWRSGEGGVDPDFAFIVTYCQKEYWENGVSYSKCHSR